MKLEDHVLKAIEAFDRNEKDHALMHSTFAIEATARKLFPQINGKTGYKKCIRQYWWLIERFIGEGLNLEDTKFSFIKLDNGKGNLISDPDLADIVYHIFRYSHAHAQEVPINYKLIPAGDGYYQWDIDRVTGGLQMPEAIIWALLAVSVFSIANTGIKTSGEHYISWGNSKIGITKFTIKDYWGKENEIKAFFSDKPQQRVKIDFKNWKKK